MAQKNFLFMGNGPNLNRGCEAIIRGTTEILDKAFSSEYTVNNTYFSWAKGVHELQGKNEKDQRVNNISLESIIQNPKPPSRFSQKWWKLQLSKLHLAEYPSNQEFKAMCSEANAAFQIGGDNYTLDYGYPYRHMNLDNIALSESTPLILWGASVGPFTKDKEFEKKITDHFNNFSGIFLREEISFNYLKSIGVRQEILHPCDDPAFYMQPSKPEEFTSDNFFSNDILGINFSPLIFKYLKFPQYETWANNCVEVIETILSDFKVNIALIPHVTAGIGENMPLHDITCADSLFLNGLRRRLQSKYKERVLCIPNSYNAQELKWIISQCSLFMGARTHSTIAAFSMNIPTLSIAYSQKAWGLNQKLFGTGKYCIDCNELSKETIGHMINLIMVDSEKVKSFLAEKNVEIAERQKATIEALHKICN